MTDSQSTLQTTPTPQSLLRRWPTLAGLGFAALVAFDLASGVELAPVLAASAAVYLGAAALRRPAAAWPLFFAITAIITVARLLETASSRPGSSSPARSPWASTACCAGPAAPATGCRSRPWRCSASAPPPAAPWS